MDYALKTNAGVLQPDTKIQLYNYFLIEIEYFTRRVEAKALGGIKTIHIITFLWKDIICK